MTFCNGHRLTPHWGILAWSLLVSSSVVQKVHAQPEHRVNASIGLAYTSTQDLMASRFISTGVNVPLRLGYESVDSSHQHYAMASFATCMMTSSSGFNSSLDQIYLGYGYNHRSFHLGKWHGYLGGEWSNGYIQRETRGLNQSTFINAFSAIRAVVRGVINLSKEQQLQLAIALPLIGFTARSGYANTPPDNLIGEDTDESLLAIAAKVGQWSWPGEFGHSTISVQYTRNFHKRMSVRWIYTFSVVRYNYPDVQRMNLLNNEITFGLSYWLNHPRKPGDGKE